MSTEKIELSDTAISVPGSILCQTFMIRILRTLPFSYKVYNTPLFASFIRFDVFAILGWKNQTTSFELSININKTTGMCYHIDGQMFNSYCDSYWQRS